jgi:apolipoprotein N-acyltransferase
MHGKVAVKPVMPKPLDQRISKPTRVVIAIICGIGMIVTHQIFPGWEQVLLATVVVIGFLLVQFREVWNQPRYWLLFAAACVAHGCVMIWLRSLMNEFRLFSTLIVIVLEAFVFFVLFRRLVVPTTSGEPAERD